VTEDEAFIRAIVDSPGDDTPRLVYADWLDDRGDPRGKYLRAEAAIPGRTNLCERVAGLDPVWVARISRPPVGVCADSVRFHGCGVALRPADLEKTERRIGVKLPLEYCAFLLNWNGGVPCPGTISRLEPVMNSRQPIG
jgi:uncharacterized protein (TIGR02996 family)